MYLIGTKGIFILNAPTDKLLRLFPYILGDYGLVLALIYLVFGTVGHFADIDGIG